MDLPKSPDNMTHLRDETEPPKVLTDDERWRRNFQIESQMIQKWLEPMLAAIRGEEVPSGPLGDDRGNTHCLVRGIRYHDEFALKLQKQQEASSDETRFPPVIWRALHARAIMSNRIPDVSDGDGDDFPYCFWYPEVPSEVTLRQLLRRFPSTKVRYQVGRACAVAGYTDLYRELDLLPDVAIAEEARDSGEKGRAIFELIMAQPVRYAVMDDYSLTVRHDAVPGAFLNGDTCVRSTLDKKQSVVDRLHSGEEQPNLLLHKPTLDIAEDWRVDVEGCRFEAQPVDPKAVELLWRPLPRDLPTVDKDLLILMAAWSGNIDRYERLRRPSEIRGEAQCVVHGIYHHTFFAKYISERPNLDPLYAQSCHARFLMDDDLSWVTESLPDEHLPELIWYPHQGSERTYRELARLKPQLTRFVARACIVANYQTLFDKLDPHPDNDLRGEASISPNPHYHDFIMQKAERMGIDLFEVLCETGYTYPYLDVRDWPYLVLYQSKNIFGPRGWPRHVPDVLTVDHVGFEVEGHTDCISSNVGAILRYVVSAGRTRRVIPLPMTGHGH
jgi:hypothetical protein